MAPRPRHARHVAQGRSQIARFPDQGDVYPFHFSSPRYFLTELGKSSYALGRREYQQILPIPPLHRTVVSNERPDWIEKLESFRSKQRPPIRRPLLIDVMRSPLTWDRRREEHERCCLSQCMNQARARAARQMFGHLEAHG